MKKGGMPQLNGGLPAFQPPLFAGPPIPPKFGPATGAPVGVNPSPLPPSPFAQNPAQPGNMQGPPSPFLNPTYLQSQGLPPFPPKLGPLPPYTGFPPPPSNLQPSASGFPPPPPGLPLFPGKAGPAQIPSPGNFAPFPQPMGFAPPLPVNFQPGRVDIIPPLQSPSSFVPVQPPPVDPLKCPFCGQRQIQPQAQTPCAHGYCSQLCLQLYIKSCYDGAHFDNIPCIACRIPFPMNFLIQTFGDENEFRRTLREHIENILRTRVCPGNEAMFNQLTGYQPQPPFNCSICRLTKPFNDKWDLGCPHTLCRECLALRITDSVRVQRNYDNIRCPYCAREVPYVDVWCLVDRDTRTAYEGILDHSTVVDNDNQLIRYDCPVHPFFVIFIDASRPWVKCNICNVRYCTRCPPNTPFDGHRCPNVAPYRR